MRLDDLARDAARDLREAGQRARFSSRVPTAGKRRRPRRPFPGGWPAWGYAAAGFVVAVAIGAVTWAILGGGEPVPPASPDTTLSSVDRWGLTGVDLPDTAAQIGAVFEAMPDEVNGYPGGATGGEHIVGYGDEGNVGSSLFAQDSQSRIGADGQPLTPTEALTLMAAEEPEVIAGVLDGDTVWLYGSHTGEDGTEYFLVWAEADSDWMFYFDGWTPEDLDALIAAFIRTTEAVMSGPSSTTEPSAMSTTTLPEETTTTVPGRGFVLADADMATLTQHLHALAPNLAEVAGVFGIESIDGSTLTGLRALVIPVPDWRAIPGIVLNEYSERRNGGVPDSFVQLMAYDTPNAASSDLASLLGSAALFGPGGEGSTVKDTFALSGFDESWGFVLDGTVVLDDDRAPPEGPDPGNPWDLTLVLGRIDRVVVAVGMVAEGGTPTQSTVAAIAEIIPDRAGRFGELLDEPRLSSGASWPSWFSLKPLDFEDLSDGTWNYEGWTIGPPGMDLTEVARDGEGLFHLTIWVYPYLHDPIGGSLAAGVSEMEALVAYAEDFASITDEWESEGVETFVEITELSVAGRPTVRVLVWGSADGETWDAHLHTFMIDGSTLVQIYVDQEFQDIDPDLLIEFAPILDLYLQALPISN